MSIRPVGLVLNIDFLCSQLATPAAINKGVLGSITTPENSLPSHQPGNENTRPGLDHDEQTQSPTDTSYAEDLVKVNMCIIEIFKFDIRNTLS